MNEHSKKSAGQKLIFISLVILAASTIYPILFMLLSSFKKQFEYMANYFALPKGLYLGNFRMSIEKFDIPRLAFNSLFVTVCSIIIIALVTSMAAFSFSKLRFKGSGIVFTLVIACMMIPGQVLMIPIYLLMSKLNLMNNFISIILFYVTIHIPFGTFLLTVNCRSIPDEILESADMDGASVLLTYAKIVIPMMKPSIMTLLILNFLSCWNELLYSMLFLQTATTRTLTVAVATVVGKYTTNMPLLMTGLLINSMPTILVFIIFQKYISKGITVGAIK